MAPGGSDDHHDGMVRVEAATKLAAHAAVGRIDQAVALLGVVALLEAAQRFLRGDEA